MAKVEVKFIKGRTPNLNDAIDAAVQAVAAANPTSMVSKVEVVKTDHNDFFVIVGLDFGGGSTGVTNVFTITDPAVDAAVATAVIDNYAGVVVTLTGAPNSQTLQAPTAVATEQEFVVVNSSSSTDDLVVTHGGGSTVTIEPGSAQRYFWDGAQWHTLTSVDAEYITYFPNLPIPITEVQSMLELLENVLPTKPDNLSGKTLSMSGTYTALEAGTGTSHNPVTDDTTPTAGVDDFYDGDRGTLTAEVDAGVTGTKALTTADDSGTYGDLVITADEDPYVGQMQRENIWKQLDANITPAAPLTYAQHTYQLKHTLTGDSALLTFYVDNPITSSISAVSDTLPGAVSRYVSGVPSLAVGETIDLDFTVDDAVGKHYSNVRIANMNSSQTTSVNLNPAAPPAEGASVSFTGESNTIIASAYAEDVTITTTPYNSKNVAGTPDNHATSARVDTVSDESSRLIAGSGQYPAAGYGGAYDSTQSLKTSYTEELQLLNGKYQVPTGNYTGNLPTAGEDYSAGMGAGDRWVIFQPTALTNNSAFTLNILNSEGTWSGTATAGIEIYAKVEGVTNWIDCNASYPGVGSPVNNGDPAMVFASSSTTVKRVTFGATPRTGTLYIRIGLPVGSNKKFSGISITNIT